MSASQRGTVAVVIPFYRDDQWFPHALESVLTQSRRPDEVIVVDDASPVGTAQALESPPTGVRVIRLAHNSGPGRARQVGTEAATSEYVCYIDADDLWSPDFVGTCVAHLSADSTIEAVYTAIAKRLPDGTVKPFVDKPPHLTVREAIVRFHAYPALAMMFRRAALLAVGGWDTSRHAVEDWDLVVRFLDRFGGIPLVAGPLPQYRVAHAPGRRNAVGWDMLRRWRFTATRNRELIERYFGPRAHRRRMAQAIRDRADVVGGITGRTMQLVRPVFGTPLDASWPMEQTS